MLLSNPRRWDCKIFGAGAAICNRHCAVPGVKASSLLLLGWSNTGNTPSSCSSPSPLGWGSPYITLLLHFHYQGNLTMIKQNTLPNKYCFSARVYGVCSCNMCFAEKPIPTQHVSCTAPITDNFLHTIFALFSLCCIDSEGLVKQLLVSKGKG